MLNINLRALLQILIFLGVLEGSLLQNGKNERQNFDKNEESQLASCAQITAL